LRPPAARAAPPEAIFWDNDGVLVDTETLYFRANRRIVRIFGGRLRGTFLKFMGIFGGRS
jgi:beta-phosphoglucomutase-like phosphatase (HAD superfamily)